MCEVVSVPMQGLVTDMDITIVEVNDVKANYTV